MPLYPLSIIFSQRNSANTKFDEKYISGSNIVFGTDGSGNLATISINNIITSISGSASTGSNTFNGNQIISGSLVVVPSDVSSSLSGSGGDITASNAYFTNSISSPSGSFVSFQLNTTASAPTNSTDVGLVGEVRLDDDYIYVYVNNKWKRISVGIWL
jgi:hypothetical protein